MTTIATASDTFQCTACSQSGPAWNLTNGAPGMYCSLRRSKGGR